jgi:hypothetical protein
MVKLTNRGRNMGERIRNGTKIPRLVYKLRYITQISRMKFLLGWENVYPGKKKRLFKLQTNYMRNKREEIHAYG